MHFKLTFIIHSSLLPRCDMSDPLSIIASVVTLISTADSILKTLQRVKDLRKAPSEILALLNEVTDLRVVLDDVSDCLTEVGETSPSDTKRLQHMTTLINRAEEQMLKLDDVIHGTIGKSKSLGDDSKMWMIQWMRAKGPVEVIRQHLRDVRLNIMTQMMVINTCVSKQELCQRTQCLCV